MKKLLIPFLLLLSCFAFGQTTVRMSATTSSTNTYTTTFNPAVSVFNTSTIYVIPFGNANSSGTVTIDPDTGGAGAAIAIKGDDGNDLAVAAIKAGGTYAFKFNGTVLKMIGSAGGGVLTDGSGTSANGTAADLGGTLIVDAAIDLNGNVFRASEGGDVLIEASAGQASIQGHGGSDDTIIEATPTEGVIQNNNNNKVSVDAAGVLIQANNAGDDILLDTGDDLNLDPTDDIQLNGATGVQGQAIRVKTNGGWEFITVNGTYTPTLFNTSNIAASTAYITGWYRVENRVTVFGKVDIDATLSASTATELGFSLPIASNMTGEEDLGGAAVSDAIASLTARIRADATNDRASIVFKSLSLSNDSYSFEFSYQIK